MKINKGIRPFRKPSKESYRRNLDVLAEGIAVLEFEQPYFAESIRPGNLCS